MRGDDEGLIRHRKGKEKKTIRRNSSSSSSLRPHINLKPQLHRLTSTLGYTPNTTHILHHKMRTTILNLRAFVAGADGDDSRTTRDARADTEGRVLEDDALLRVEAQTLGGEEERVGIGFAGFETLVICGDRHGWGCDADASHCAVRVGLCTRGSDGIPALGDRVDHLTHTGEDLDRAVDAVSLDLPRSLDVARPPWRTA